MADISAFDNFFDNFPQKIRFCDKKAQNTVKKAQNPVKRAQNGV